MYQQLVKRGGNNYSERDIEEIYNYVITENEKYERMYLKNKCEDYLDKIRDTEIFKKYDFISSQTEK